MIPITAASPVTKVDKTINQIRRVDFLRTLPDTTFGSDSEVIAGFSLALHSARYLAFWNCRLPNLFARQSLDGIGFPGRAWEPVVTDRDAVPARRRRTTAARHGAGRG